MKHHTIKIKYIGFYFCILILLSAFTSCKSKSRLASKSKPVEESTAQPKINLATLTLTEKIEEVINYSDESTIGIETLMAGFDLMIEVTSSNSFSFNDIELKDASIMFRIRSENIKKDEELRRGAHWRVTSLNNSEDLQKAIDEYEAEDSIYAYNLDIKSDSLKNQIKKELIKMYGKETKNPNIENGLYWNVKKENKVVFFTPFFDKLIVVNNANQSKNCYFDSIHGLIDFGGCDKLKYIEELRERNEF